VTLVAGQNAVCTITNTRKARLIVDKVTVGGGVQLFSFTVTGGISFQLADATTPYNSGITLVPGVYRVCEVNLAAGWQNPTITVNAAPATVINPDDPQLLGNFCVDVTLAAGDTKTVVVTNTPPPQGGTRTIGYWKNHASCSRGADGDGKQYVKAIERGEPEATLDFYLGAGSSIYPIGDITSLTCEQAVALLSKSAIDGTKRAGDPIYNMVAQLLGAKLNVAANAGTCAALNTALAAAQTFLANLDFLGTGSYKGVLSASDQNLVNGWAGVFGSYNEGTLGGGCPTHV
jgi:hypothetical protein